ncbi:MAG: M48 family metallopeptidase [Ignavibacteriota bacterium]|nr:M48 family peptidase [Ignavibacteriota bacterium]MBW7843386.1 M48 family metallopeptidase [Ignavibacterium sp.]MCO6446142.1 M48 family metallopeptidase [Ignavibacterium album]MCZ2270026.1 M48 family metallopeptidase [Ignavibacteriales bacterium]HOJ08519.1 M48 family metallopeptidase [Ignavibacteriaceae bacterium]
MKLIKIFVPIILLALTVYYCSTVPITGRSQLNLISSNEMNAMSFQQYDEFLKQNKLSSNKNDVDMVKRIGAKIQKSVETYFAQHNLSNELDGYQWEFNLVESNEVNAWCMPGGKVVVYTGILPITKDETGLAVVMGHEIAHAVAQHGNERMSQGLIQQLGGVALAVALKDQPATTQNIFMAAYGIGSTVGIMLPFSRTHESEADHLGLIFMAMAGYNPNAAVDFWTRMAANSQGAPPEWLSTHPSNETRIADIKKLLPEALKYYNPN